MAINNHAPTVTVQDLVMGKEQLWARSKTDQVGVMKFYINPGGDLINNGTGVTNPNGGENVAVGLDYEPFTSWQFSVIRSTTSLISSLINLQLEETLNPSEADFHIVRIPVSLGAFTASLSFPNLIDVLTHQNLSKIPAVGDNDLGKPFIQMSVDAGVLPNRSAESADNTVFGATFKHELGHMLGLEHPWESDDGDVATYKIGSKEFAVTGAGYFKGPTVMDFDTTPDGIFDINHTGIATDRFELLDISAIQTIWGEPGETSPIYSLGPYSALNEQNKSDQIFIANDTITSFELSFERSSATQFFIERGTTNPDIYIISHPDIGRDTLVGFDTIVFTDQTVSVLQESDVEYPATNLTNNITFNGSFAQFDLDLVQSSPGIHFGASSIEIAPDEIGRTITINQTGGAGTGRRNDTFNGTSGIDTVAFSGSKAEYTLEETGRNVAITDTVFDRDGTDLLNSIENYQFNDGIFQLSELLNVTDIDRGIYRFFNVDTGTHFLSGSTVERDSVINNLDAFNFEGPTFRAADPTNAAADTVFRFFNTQTGTHFFTQSTLERDNILETLPQFSFEGEAYKGYTEQVDGSIPLYRFFNTQTGTHFYTAAEAEKDSIIENLPTFNFEGTAYWVDPVMG